jgi:hypothetical protein
MELRELELTLETTLAVTRPTPREVRDGLVDYYSTIAKPFVVKGLAFTDPKADETLVRRLMLARLGLLWQDLSSPWDRPTLDDLRVFRRRIERYSCMKHDPGMVKIGELIDQLFLGASVGERLEASRAKKPVRRFQLVEGGGNLTAPIGKLRLLKADQDSTSTTAP